MAIEILMPSLSPGMEEGKLAKWLVQEGAEVSAGDIIAEIETDKATLEFEAHQSGVLARLIVPAGTDGVAVGTPLAVMASDEDGEMEAVPAETPEPHSTSPARQPAAVTASPGRDNAATAEQAAMESANSPRIFMSPLARRLAREAGLDPAGLSGTGPRGRILRADVEAALTPDKHADARPAGGSHAADREDTGPVSSPADDDMVLKVFEEGSFRRVPHDSMRKTIARRLTLAKTTIPHFYLTVNCEIDALLELRGRLNAAAPIKSAAETSEPAYRISVNDMVVKALASALAAVPNANASWTESEMLIHEHADIAVAVALDGGLITPVVRRAEQKTISVISNEIRELARRARNKELRPEEYQGGTTAVSNLGMYGISEFSAIINPPHGTILAIGEAVQKPVVKNGAIVPATIMRVTLSADHRAVDGALGAQLLAAFRNGIENPLSLLV